MPRISFFYGIMIQMFWQEHGNPHFHALYAEFEALIDIQTLDVFARLSAPKGFVIGQRVGSVTPARIDGGLEIMRKQAETVQDSATGVTPCVPWRVTGAILLPNFRLSVELVDGTKGVVDLSRLVESDEAGVFAVLRNTSLFEKVFVENGVVTWPGEIDLAPDAVYDEITRNGKWVVE